MIVWDLLDLLGHIFSPIIDVCLHHAGRDEASEDDRRVGIGCVAILLAIVAVFCLIVFLTRL